MWTFDMDAKTAAAAQAGYRQVRKQQRRLDTRPIAAEIVSLILAHQKDPRLKWRNDGSVLVRIGMISGLEEAHAQVRVFA
jgi:hypothetical protein